MKKLLILVLSLCLCTLALLTACGEGDGSTNETSDGNETEKSNVNNTVDSSSAMGTTDSSKGDSTTISSTEDSATNPSMGGTTSSTEDGTTDSSVSGGTTDSSVSGGTTDSSVSGGATDSSVSGGTTDSSISGGATDSSVNGGTTDSSKNDDPVDEEPKEKYDYENMSDYITLPDFKNHIFQLKEDDIMMAIGTYLMQFSSEYTVKKGDKIQVDMKFWLPNPDIDMKGYEITELAQDDLWVEQVCIPSAEDGYQLSYQIEGAMLGAKIGTTISKIIVLDEDFYVEEYRGKRVFVDITINTKMCQAGDVVLAAYTGYYIDENGQIVVENGQEKIFDTSSNSSFYIGSHLAIDDFEQGMIGMAVGETKDIYATFPQDYGHDLGGKRVMFRVKLLSVYTPPVYNDAFVKNYFSSFDTTEDFEAALKNEYILSLVYDYIDENAEVISYPTEEYDEAVKQLEEVEKSFNEQYGITLDQYLKQMYGMTREEYIKSNMKTEMVFYALRNELGEEAVPGEEEILKEKEALIESYKLQYMQGGLSQALALQKAVEYVNALGMTYIYEQVMYGKIDNLIPATVQTEIIPSENAYVWVNK